MFKDIKQCWYISLNSFTNILSDPVFLILQISILFALALISSMPSFSFGESLRIIRDQNLALLFIGACLCGLIAVSLVVIRDLKQGAVAVLMSRPVSASWVIWGKYLGVALTIIVYTITAGIGVVWMTGLDAGLDSMNTRLDVISLILYFSSIAVSLLIVALKQYFFGGSFVWPSCVGLMIGMAIGFAIAALIKGEPGPYSTGFDWRTSLGVLLVIPGALIFVSILFPLAVKFDQSAVIGIGFIVFVTGLISKFIVDQLLPGLQGTWIYTTLGAAIPNWQVLWISDRLANPNPIDMGEFLPYIGHLYIHSFLYATIFLVIASILFNRREFSGNDTF
ncbi:MAG: hypothetical protein MK193_10355 [Lentisphaeria bacterium]|nr:hypothetical protein [Lentisphaeria bacterium]